VVRARHPLQGRSLELLGSSRGRGVLHLLLVLPDGSRSLIPLAWADLESAARSHGRACSRRWMICLLPGECLSRCSSVPSCPNGMIVCRGAIVQLHLDLADGAAPVVAL